MKYRLITFLMMVMPAVFCGNKYYFFQETTQGYSASNEAIRAICEDENGFMWFGSINGLYYHNTNNIEKVNFHEVNDIKCYPDRINNIYKDNCKDLWFCSDKGLFKYIRAKSKFIQKALCFHKTKEPIKRPVNNLMQINKRTYLVHLGNGVFKFNKNDSILQPINAFINDSICFTHKDVHDIIYIGTYDGRIYISKNNLKDLKLLYHSTKGCLSTICRDGNKYLIGYPESGIDVVNFDGAKISELGSRHKGVQHLKDDNIRQIIKLKNGEVWIATYIGIIILNKDKQIFLDSRIETGLPHRTIFTMYEGSNNSVWVGTYSGGLAYYSEYNYVFQYVPVDDARKQSVRNDVSSFCEDSRGHVWIGSEDEGGVQVFDIGLNNFIRNLSMDLGKNIKGVKTLESVGNSLMAIGTTFSNEVILYNYNKHKVEKIINLPLSYSPGILGIKYFNNKLWVHDRNRLVSYNLETQEIKPIFLSSARIWHLFFDSSHNLWISTEKGLYLKKASTDIVEKCNFVKSVYNLRDAFIYSICEDKDGLLWIGTMGKGLYVYYPEEDKIQKAPDYLFAERADIYSLIKDKQNNIWYNTNQGLYRYDVRFKHTDCYNINDGLSGFRTRPNSAYCSQNGNLYFGSKSGFNLINPNNINKNPHAPKVYLSGVTVNNYPFYNTMVSMSNCVDLTRLKSITLNAEQNTLGFSIVSNNYIKSEKNRFKYRLVNYEDNWVEVSQNEDIVFTKVPPGSYIFEAYGSNNDRVWSKKPYQLEVVILPPYYKSGYAIFLYVVVLIVLIYFIYKELNTKIRLKKEISEERYKSRVKEMVYSERIKIFTNISHELRAPLSLVMSPIRFLLKKASYDSQTQQLLNVADRNAKRLLKIADQTLDFRLLEIGKLQPNFEKHELVQLTKDVYLCFEQQIIDRQINFSFTSEFQLFNVVIDGDMVEKIIYNLLSNAIKYTPEKESISLLISGKNLSKNDYENTTCAGDEFYGDAISINITDTGKGIKQELLPQIFERFVNGEQSHVTSTGIGLHLCKEYSKMNKGNMQIISEEEKGSSFILNLPVSEEIDYQSGIEKQLVRCELDNREIVQYVDESYKNADAASVLIVEDNRELRDFLRSFLGVYYKVFVARNGEQAIKMLEDFKPNLIITDVCMPGISGIDLTKMLKQEMDYQHIPIIVMTAYVDRKCQMESIVVGADAFFAKPIDEPMLLAQVNNILVKERANITVNRQSEHEFIEEGSFIAKAERIVESNLQNTSFDMGHLLNELNISKTTLTRKIKAETQLNPSGFIRDVRLKNAVKLLRTNQFNVDEIANYVGFNSTSYFIRSFKIKYGVTPKNYRRKWGM